MRPQYFLNISKKNSPYLVPKSQCDAVDWELWFRSDLTPFATRSSVKYIRLKNKILLIVCVQCASVLHIDVTTNHLAQFFNVVCSYSTSINLCFGFPLAPLAGWQPVGSNLSILTLASSSAHVHTISALLLRFYYMIFFFQSALSLSCSHSRMRGLAPPRHIFSTSVNLALHRESLSLTHVNMLHRPDSNPACIPWIPCLCQKKDCSIAVADVT